MITHVLLMHSVWLVGPEEEDFEELTDDAEELFEEDLSELLLELDDGGLHVEPITHSSFPDS